MTKTKQVVIVEGYTDVMAAHLAGITTAVATCGTAFGPGHIKMVRRMITDDGSGGEIILPSTATLQDRRPPWQPSRRISASSRRPS